MTARISKTTGTKQRTLNMKRLIQELGKRDLMMADICDVLEPLSLAGARKYARGLRDAGVIEISTYLGENARLVGKSVCQLTDDKEAAAKFLAECELSKAGRRTDAVILKRSRMEASGRHFHIMGDDAHFAVKVSRAPIVRDALVQALFGPAKVAA